MIYWAIGFYLMGARLMYMHCRVLFNVIKVMRHFDSESEEIAKEMDGVTPKQNVVGSLLLSILWPATVIHLSFKGK